MLMGPHISHSQKATADVLKRGTITRRIGDTCTVQCNETRESIIPREGRTELWRLGQENVLDWKGLSSVKAPFDSRSASKLQQDYCAHCKGVFALIVRKESFRHRTHPLKETHDPSRVREYLP